MNVEREQLAGRLPAVTERNEGIDWAADQALLRESQERYRALFDSIDEGFCTIEMIFDGEGRPVDYRFLEANPSFVDQTGLEDAVGRTVREMVPGHEEYWFDIYGRIALTGEPERFTNEAKALGRWYDVYAFRVGEPQERKVAVLFNDITERRRTEEISARLAAIVTSSEDAIISKDLNGIITSWNNGAERLFGYASEEAIGKPVTMLIPPDHLDEEPRILDRIRRGEAVEHYETVRQHKDGTRLDISLTVSPVRDAAGRIIAASKVARDITERKRAEAAAAEAAERDAFRVELGDALRPLGDPVEVQNTAVRLLGERLGADRAFYAEIQPDEDHVVVRAEHGRGKPSVGERHSISAYGPSLVAEYRSGRAVVISDAQDDPLVPAQLRDAWESLGIRAVIGVPLVKGGRFVAAVGVNQSTPRGWTPAEIALVEETAERMWAAGERARAEEALRESEQRLALELAAARQLQEISTRLMAEDTPEALYDEILDAAVAIMRSDFASLQKLHPERGFDGELELLGSRGFTQEAVAFFQWVGITSGSACGEALRTKRRCIVPDVETCDFMIGTDDLPAQLQTGIHAVQTTLLQSRSGRVLGMISTHWRDAHEPSEHELRLFDALARQAADLIERSESEAELRHSSQLKDELLGMVSHEFRTPLTTILGNIDVLARRFDQIPAPMREEVLRELRGDSARLLRLVESMLIIARRDSGILPDMEPILLQRIVPGMVEARRRDDASQPIRLAMETDLPPVVGNRGYVEQVVENLLTNARKYGDRGFPIEVTAARQNNCAVVTVRNRGGSLEPETVQRFFEPFYRDASLPRATGGAGLGLAVCSRLVDAMGGEIRADAVPEGGLEVSFSIPVADVAAARS